MGMKLDLVEKRGRKDDEVPGPLIPGRGIHGGHKEAVSAGHRLRRPHAFREKIAVSASMVSPRFQDVAS
jgi:hypothetical protein